MFDYREHGSVCLQGVCLMAENVFIFSVFDYGECVWIQRKCLVTESVVAGSVFGYRLNGSCLFNVSEII